MRHLQLLLVLALCLLWSCGTEKYQYKAEENTSPKDVTLPNQHRHSYYTDSIAAFLHKNYSSSTDSILPVEVLKFVPKQQQVWQLEKGDLNLDQRPDYLLVVVQPHPEDTQYSNHFFYPPTLLLLLRQPDNSLVLSRRSNTVLQDTSGNYFNFYGISIDTAGVFSFTHQQSLNRGYIEYSHHFFYNRKRKDWFLAEYSSFTENMPTYPTLPEDADDSTREAYELSINELETYYGQLILTPKDFGRIAIGKFNINTTLLPFMDKEEIRIYPDPDTL